MSPMLAVLDLSVSYGQISALQNVSMLVAVGAAVSLVGANGSGKTMLMKNVMGLIAPKAGSLKYQGRDFAVQRAFKRTREGTGYPLEGRRIFPGLTVRANLEVASLSEAKSTQNAMDRMYSMFPALKIKDR
jgi:branched-chain amino acid transport system ATP-binding protein